MKKIFGLTVLSLILSLSITGCGIPGSHSKYCTVPGCPQESASGADYCYRHKCFNSSCKNRAVTDYGYCTECLKRASKK
ncbi:MAG: hypothetical protein J5590_00945 [Clostridia bacterium]|nr:hypothetical protein [Clostridia bacterium]